MSERETAVEMSEARRLAAKRARSSYGTFIRVGDGSYNPDQNTYNFPLIVRPPRVIHSENRETVIDVRFQSEIQVGQITIHGDDRSLEAPHRATVMSKIRARDKTIESAIRKALVSTSGRRFSHLPFLENQFSPLEDLLSQLILDRSITLDQNVDESFQERYRKYIGSLEDIDLVDIGEGEQITAGDALINVLDDRSEDYHKALNDAMGIYFENNLDDFDMIYRTLGPYLVIAGRYYQRSLELEEMPTIHEQELRDAISAEYSGHRREEKLVKFSRYLIQLQEVGILEPVFESGERLWSGRETIRRDLETVADQFEPLQDLLVSYS